MELAIGGLNMGMGELERANRFPRPLHLRIRDVEVSRPCWVRRLKISPMKTQRLVKRQRPSLIFMDKKKKNRTSSVREKPGFDGSSASLLLFLSFLFFIF
ncbi:hypothetical protein BT93_B1475 [Corymbia citriodora subsp. variegata]|nr:hypothetical protein BT93_B1475 [Corymbia citriodora subsp. variegata]